MIFNNTGIDFQSNNISLASFCVFLFFLGGGDYTGECMCFVFVGWLVGCFC